MSLKKRSTTGLPSTNRRDSDVRRKYRSRSQREGEINRLVLMISGVIAAVIVVILGSAFFDRRGHQTGASSCQRRWSERQPARFSGARDV